MTTGTITGTYIKLGGKYYTANRHTTRDYSEYKNEILDQFKLKIKEVS